MTMVEAAPSGSAQNARAPTRLSPSLVVLLATAAALVAGTAQVLVVLVRRDLLHQFTFTSRDVIWMSPLGNLILVAPLALALVVFAWLAPRRIALPVTAWLFGCYAAYSIVLLFPRMHQIAMIVLSLAAAFKVAGAVDRAPDRWVPRLRRMTLVMGLALGVLAIADRSWRAVQEWRAMGSLAEAPAGAPNLLLLILDTVRAANLRLYGYERTTAPEIARRGGEGAVFNWAISTTSWTLPSHASMFTGRRPDELSARMLEPLDGEHPTLAEVFRDNGYATGGFIANYVYTTHESGLGRGFVRYADYRVSLKEALLTATIARTDSFRDAIRNLFWDRWIGGAVRAVLSHRFVSTVRYPDADRKDAHTVNGEFLRWQAGLGNRPFFAFLNYFDAHTPYRPPAPFKSKFSPQPTRKDLYDSGIAYIDHELTQLFEELDRRGVLDRTIVVIASDHGEQFGEHGKEQHANSLYLQVTRVPLVIRFPSAVKAGIHIDRVVTLQDLPATLLDLAGARAAGGIGGASFASLLTGGESRAGSPVVAELEEHSGMGKVNQSAEIRALFDDSLHYIVDGRGFEHIYAYRTDPRERQNLLRTPLGQEAVRRFRAELRRVSGADRYALEP